MDNSARAKRLLGLAGLILGVTVLTGCPEEDPVGTITTPGTGTEVIANFIISSGDGFGKPAGTFSTAGLTDVFSRSTGPLGFKNNNNPFNFSTWNFQDLIRTSATDPRLPALDAATQDAFASSLFFGSPFCLLGDGSWTGTGFWDLFCEISNLKPSTIYTVVMAQYRLQINGELDAAQVLRGQPVTDPDELILMDTGTPKGYPDVPCDFSTPTPVLPDANPFVLGFIVTFSQGTGLIDCLPQSPAGSALWYRGDDPQLDSLPVMPNQIFLEPQPSFTYNYWYLVEGQGTAQDPVPDGPIALRVQMGPDLRADGLPHFNAFGPFPTEASTAPPPPDLQVEMGPLPPLTGSNVYQLWLYNDGDQSATPLTARTIDLIDNEADTRETIGQDVAAAVQGGALNETFELNVFMEDNPGELLDGNHVVVSVEGSALPSAPSQVVALYRGFADISDPQFPLVQGTGSLTFGGFDLAAGTPGRTWGFAGQGLAHFLGDAFRARVENIPRPPTGFAYFGWLVGSDDEGNQTFHSLGPLTVDNPPTYTPLLNADVDRNIPSAANSVVAPTFIAEAINWSLVGDVPTLGSFAGEHPFCNVSNYWVTLEPKDVADLNEPGPTVAITGATPETFLRSPLCERTESE